MGKVNLNFSKIVNENKKFQKQAESLAREKFETSKDNFLENFDNHPITKEIESGASGTNISRTLNGIGNLFSFIGFYRDDNPIGQLRNLLNKKFIFKKRNIGGKLQFSIEYPTLDKIKAETPLPWEGGRSWVAGIERGISGLGNYMFKTFSEGRSQEALQSKNKIRGNAYKPTKYMSDLINKFIKEAKS